MQTAPELNNQPDVYSEPVAQIKDSEETEGEKVVELNKQALEEAAVGAEASVRHETFSAEASTEAVKEDSVITPVFPEVEGLVGVGVDIVDIEHMRRILKRTPSFASKVFSADEQAYCNSMTDPASHFALRFAAKEAVLKALGTGFFESGIGIRDVEVRRNDKGAPFVCLYGAAKKRAEELGVREIPLSLSYTHQEAVAFVMSITNESIRVKEQRKDPKADLAQKFKQARGMLDEL